MCAINGGATARSLDNRDYLLPRCASGGALRTVREQRAQSHRATALFIITKSKKNISTFGNALLLGNILYSSKRAFFKQVTQVFR